jgi:hypothetical protein
MTLALASACFHIDKLYLLYSKWLIALICELWCKFRINKFTHIFKFTSVIQHNILIGVRVQYIQRHHSEIHERVPLKTYNEMQHFKHRPNNLKLIYYLHLFTLYSTEKYF